jgi:biotin carboxyl carrier protein
MEPIMTRYHAKQLGIKDAPVHDLEVKKLENGRYLVQLDGKKSEIDALFLPNGSISLLLGQRSVLAQFDERHDGLQVLINGQATKVETLTETQLRQRAISAGFTAEGIQTVCAPMPGKVVKILVKSGDVVKEGQGLVVVEAMKMENELKSPKDGTVKEIFAKEGVAVENGAKLLIVE